MSGCVILSPQTFPGQHFTTRGNRQNFQHAFSVTLTSNPLISAIIATSRAVLVVVTVSTPDFSGPGWTGCFMCALWRVWVTKRWLWASRVSPSRRPAVAPVCSWIWGPRVTPVAVSPYHSDGLATIRQYWSSVENTNVYSYLDKTTKPWC